jgi:CHAD domain-containing protein
MRSALAEPPFAPVLPRFPSKTTGDPRPALAGAIPGLVHEARRALALDPADAQGLHRLRVALKRMRSLWRLAYSLRPGPKPRRARAILGRAASRLAPARNREVAESLLREFLTIETPSRRPLPPPRGAAERAGDLVEASVLEFLAFPLPREGPRPWKDALAKAYRRARARMPDSKSARDEAFHAWRKTVKDLLYCLEAWPEPRRKRFQRLLAKLEVLQQGLGRAHDLYIAEASLEPASGNKERKHALRRIEAEKKSWKGKCLRYGEKLFAEPAAKFRKRFLEA